VPEWKIAEIAADDEKKRVEAIEEKRRRAAAATQAERDAIRAAEEAEQLEIERIEREAINAARRAWEKELKIGEELERIFNDQPPASLTGEEDAEPQGVDEKRREAHAAAQDRNGGTRNGGPA
jgi:hypothetical protein